jgi:hypothetical protein
MIKVVKTTFEQEQNEKEEAWLKLMPSQRLEIAYKIINMVRKPEVNYSYKGQKVKITRLP